MLPLMGCIVVAGLTVIKGGFSSACYRCSFSNYSCCFSPFLTLSISASTSLDRQAGRCSLAGIRGLGVTKPSFYFSFFPACSCTTSSKLSMDSSKSNSALSTLETRSAAASLSNRCSCSRYFCARIIFSTSDWYACGSCYLCSSLRQFSALSWLIKPSLLLQDWRRLSKFTMSHRSCYAASSASVASLGLWLDTSDSAAHLTTRRLMSARKLMFTTLSRL